MCAAKHESVWDQMMRLYVLLSLRSRAFASGFCWETEKASMLSRLTVITQPGADGVSVMILFSKIISNAL